MLIKLNEILDVLNVKMEVNVELIQSCAPIRWKCTQIIVVFDDNLLIVKNNMK